MIERKLRMRIAHGDVVHGLLLAPEEQSASTNLIVLGHGVSNNMDHPLMRGVAHGLVARGHEVALFNFPFAQAGRPTPDPEPVLVGSLEFIARAALDGRRKRLVIGGKSLGARVAARAAAMGFDCRGLVFLGFPLHTPELHVDTRDDLIRSVRRPMLFIQGTRDPFCHLDLLRISLRQVEVPVTLHLIEGGEHSYVVRGRAMRDIHAELVKAIDHWLAGLDKPDQIE